MARGLSLGHAHGTTVLGAFDAELHFAIDQREQRMVPADTDIVAGVDVAKHPEEAQRNIGYLADFFAVYEDLKVWEYLDYFAHAYKLAGPGQHVDGWEQILYPLQPPH